MDRKKEINLGETDERSERKGDLARHKPDRLIEDVTLCLLLDPGRHHDRRRIRMSKVEDSSRQFQHPKPSHLTRGRRQIREDFRVM
ncbi:hypothetical protein EAI_10377 [Harpegnathos saltator]|uniref:Uncharacterized protein n=1 Tax=Harpegnathos saltator TaxID=610380 RepID=E2B5R8_HARSA|nr:hypothetical protein EAI_10377 [Harpegnathos saltator]